MVTRSQVMVMMMMIFSFLMFPEKGHDIYQVVVVDYDGD